MEDKKEAAAAGAGSSAPDRTDPASLPDQDTRLIMTVRNRINRPPGWIYSCFFCPKTFHNPQALGGHQNTHRREREIQMKEYDLKRKGRLHDRAARSAHPERTLAPRHDPVFKPRYHSGLAPRSGALFGQMVMGPPVCLPPTPGYPPLIAYGPPPHFNPYGPDHGFAPRFEGAPLHGPSLRPQNEIIEDTSAVQPPSRHELTTRDFFVEARPEPEGKQVFHQPQHNHHPVVNTTGDTATPRERDDPSDPNLASAAHEEAENKIREELSQDVNVDLDLSLKL